MTSTDTPAPTDTPGTPATSPRGRMSLFCETHFSWLCHQGTGKCGPLGPKSDADALLR